MIRRSELHVRKIGTGPMIAFFHGWGCTNTMWNALTAHLRHRFTCLLISTNLSQPIFKNNYSTVLGSQVYEIIQQYSATTAVRGLICWSMGGFIPYYLQHAGMQPLPSVFISSFCRFMKSENNPYGMPKAHLRALNNGLQKDLPKTISGFFQACGFSANKNNIDFSVYNAAALSQQLDVLQESDMSSHAAAYTAPTLVIHGDADAIVHHSIGENLARYLPASRFILAANHNHVMAISAPDMIARYCIDFFTGVGL